MPSWLVWWENHRLWLQTDGFQSTIVGPGPCDCTAHGGKGILSAFVSAQPPLCVCTSPARPSGILAPQTSVFPSVLFHRAPSGSKEKASQSAPPYQKVRGAVSRGGWLSSGHLGAGVGPGRSPLPDRSGCVPHLGHAMSLYLFIVVSLTSIIV